MPIQLKYDWEINWNYSGEFVNYKMCSSHPIISDQFVTKLQRILCTSQAEHLDQFICNVLLDLGRTMLKILDCFHPIFNQILWYVLELRQFFREKIGSLKMFLQYWFTNRKEKMSLLSKRVNVFLIIWALCLKYMIHIT